MIKIVFDHQIFSFQSFGGVSRYYYELASRLAELNEFDVSVIAPFHINEYLYQSHANFVKGLSLPCNFNGSDRLKQWGRKALLPLHYAFNNSADIIHETYYSLQPTGKGKCRVITVHDMIHELFSEYFKNDIIYEAKRSAVSRADHVICVSESTRNDLIRLFNVDPDKTSVVHHGYKLLNDMPLSFGNKPGKNKPYLLYVGNRGLYKNFLSFCHAFALSPFLKKNFDIVAFGGAPFSPQEVTTLTTLGLLDYTHHITGNDNVLASYYKEARMFVYPSLYEGFGISPLEAMNFGCPVACSNTSSIPEVVGDAGLYFDPGSVESIRDAMEKLIEDSELRATLIAKGYERLKLFSWDKCARKTADIYKAVIHETSVCVTMHL